MPCAQVTPGSGGACSECGVVSRAEARSVLQFWWALGPAAPVPAQRAAILTGGASASVLYSCPLTHTLVGLVGLFSLHGLESNPGSSLQTEEEAGLP